jgi:hypothetical protein
VALILVFTGLEEVFKLVGVAGAASFRGAASYSLTAARTIAAMLSGSGRTWSLVTVSFGAAVT